MVWAISKKGFRFEVVEVTRETEKMVLYKTLYGRDKRSPKDGLFDWRGDKQSALKAVEKLESARSEKNRRENAARDWYATRQDEIIASLTRCEASGDIMN